MHVSIIMSAFQALNPKGDIIIELPNFCVLPAKPWRSGPQKFKMTYMKKALLLLSLLATCLAIKHRPSQKTKPRSHRRGSPAQSHGRSYKEALSKLTAKN